jgi:hypothetical protein
MPPLCRASCISSDRATVDEGSGDRQTATAGDEDHSTGIPPTSGPPSSPAPAAGRQRERADSTSTQVIALRFDRIQKLAVPAPCLTPDVGGTSIATCTPVPQSGRRTHHPVQAPPLGPRTHAALRRAAMTRPGEVDSASSRVLRLGATKRDVSRTSDET